MNLLQLHIHQLIDKATLILLGPLVAVGGSSSSCGRSRGRVVVSQQFLELGIVNVLGFPWPVLGRLQCPAKPHLVCWKDTKAAV